MMTSSSISIGGLIVLIADIYAIVMILQSAASNGEKLIWCIAILLLPVIGFIVWFLAGPGRKRA
jgi:hypothetical protein